MAEYFLKPTRENLHGSLSSKIAPVLTVLPGDTVSITTMEPDWRVERPPVAKLDAGRFYEQRIPGYDDGHALCGPIAIEGAKPGMTLAVDILNVVPDNWGWSCTGLGNQEHLDRMGFSGEALFWLWDIDVEKGVCCSNGYTAPIRPFPGVVAVAPQGEETVTTKIPGSHGGNLDCRSLVPGTRILLPVFHPGALFSAGDGHAVQGDGESCGTAVECPLKELKLRFSLLDMPIWGPILENGDEIQTFGFSSDVTEAAYQALENMRRYLKRFCGVANNKEAMMLCSVFADLRITQIVNGVRGVHAVLSLNGMRTQE